MKTKPRYCHACIVPTGDVPLVNGECAECREALKVHRQFVDGRGAEPPPVQEPAAVRRGRSLSRTERFSQAEMLAVYSQVMAEGVQ